MKISLLNEQLTIQKNSVVIDSVGNHKNEWTDYYSCYSYAATSGYQQKEQQAAGIMVSDEGLVFTVRYCSELADLDSTHFRVLFQGEPYNITAVDRMNYQRKTLKITCEKERRNT